MPSRQSRRLDKLTEKMPLDTRVHIWIQAVADATPAGVSWRRADEEHRKWLSEIEEAVPDQQWEEWEERRSDLLSLYGIASERLGDTVRRFVRATMHLAVLDMALWLRQTDGNGELARSVQALLEDKPRRRKTAAAYSRERLTEIATALDAGVDWVGHEIPDLWRAKDGNDLDENPGVPGTIVMQHMVTASLDEAQQTLVAVARRVLDEAAQCEAVLAIIEEELARHGQHSLMSAWAALGQEIARHATALRHNHSAFAGRYEPRTDEKELERLRTYTGALHYYLPGFSNVLRYYEWLGMDPPQHPLQRRRAYAEERGALYRPHPQEEEGAPAGRTKSLTRIGMRQGRQRGDLDTQR